MDRSKPPLSNEAVSPPRTSPLALRNISIGMAVATIGDFLGRIINLFLATLRLMSLRCILVVIHTEIDFYRRLDSN